jgi:2-keto-4-pentenoate hydratase/2-oxohepta-3-ene-1,7-dioic acid hydratase in catechol pathway
VIGRTCRAVSERAALEHVFGYTCANDVTAVDILTRNPDFAQWCRRRATTRSARSARRSRPARSVDADDPDR